MEKKQMREEGRGVDHMADQFKQPVKSSLQQKVERLIKKADKQKYEFNSLELSIFAALGNSNWDEEKVNWLALQQFETLYRKFYSSKK